MYIVHIYIYNIINYNTIIVISDIYIDKYTKMNNNNNKLIRPQYCINACLYILLPIFI